MLKCLDVNRPLVDAAQFVHVQVSVNGEEF